MGDKIIREIPDVEDSIAGIEAGHRAGAIVVGLTGTCSEEELTRAGVNYIIRCLEDISSTLSQIEVQLVIT